MGDTPLIIPVSAPGATAATAELTAFKDAVLKQAAAQEKAAATGVGATKATKEGAAADVDATVKKKAHIRTIEEEVVRLKELEHQRKITAQARAALGESGNAGDLSALRRFARQMPGGIGREAARGGVEAYEGMEGTGLRSTLGFAGAGLAGLTIGIEGLKTVIEAATALDERKFEIEQEHVRVIREANDKMGDIGSNFAEKFGETFQKIIAAAGPGGVEAANKYALDTKDTSAFAAYGTASEKFGNAKDRAVALEAVKLFHEAGGGTVLEGVNSLKPEYVQRALAISGEHADRQLAREMLGDHEQHTAISEDDLNARIANRQSSAMVQNLEKIELLKVQSIEVAELQLPAAVGKAARDAADTATPAASGFTSPVVIDQQTKLQHEAKLADEHENTPGLFTGAGYTALHYYQDLFHGWGMGAGSPQTQAMEGAIHTGDLAGKSALPSAFSAEDEATGHLKVAAQNAQAVADALNAMARKGMIPGSAAKPNRPFMGSGP